jgi:hypothetical protein
MSLAFVVFEEKSRLKSLLDHFSIIDEGLSLSLRAYQMW